MRVELFHRERFGQHDPPEPALAGEARQPPGLGVDLGDETVGSVPAVTGVGRCRARAPASASTSTIVVNRPISMASPSAVL